MHSTLYRAVFDTAPGVALRDVGGRVHFADDATGVWRKLYDVDSPRLVLLGRVDLALTQRLADAGSVRGVEHDKGRMTV